MKPMRMAVSPEPKEMEVHVEPVEMHAVKKYGKYHSHVVMSDGAEHKGKHETMHEAHAAMAEHMAEPENHEQNASESAPADGEAPSYNA